MSTKGFDIFDDDKTNKNSNPTFEILLKYQKHHMKLLEDYEDQISYIDMLLRNIRMEREKFFLEDISNIRNKLIEEHIDETVINEWLTKLERAMTKSFDESDKLASAFAVKKATQFKEILEEKMKGL